MIVWVKITLNRTVVKLLTVTDTLTLKMTSTQVVETSVTTVLFRTMFTRLIILDLLMKCLTSGFKPFTVLVAY